MTAELKCTDQNLIDLPPHPIKTIKVSKNSSSISFIIIAIYTAGSLQLIHYTLCRYTKCCEAHHYIEKPHSQKQLYSQHYPRVRQQCAISNEITSLLFLIRKTLCSRQLYMFCQEVCQNDNNIVYLPCNKTELANTMVTTKNA